MFIPLLQVFMDVVLPVACVVGLSFFFGNRLSLDPRTMSRAAYYILVPAFTFNIISRADMDLDTAVRMVAFIVTTHIAFGMIGFAVARLLRRSREMIAAYVMAAVFGNIGNFGLALIDFRLGTEALVPATVYFVAVTIISFIICIGISGWARGGSGVAVLSIFKSPVVIVLAPAIFFAATGIPVPVLVDRVTGLLGKAMIPTMLMVLGLQLARAEHLRMDGDVIIASGIRLLAGPLVAIGVVGLFGMPDLVRTTGILQCSMPVAVITTIIATEFGMVPTFLTKTVFYSTLLSLPTLTVLLHFA